MNAYDLVLPRCCPRRIREWSAMADMLTKAKIEKFIATGVPAGKTQAVLWDGAVTGLACGSGWGARPRGHSNIAPRAQAGPNRRAR